MLAGVYDPRAGDDHTRAGRRMRNAFGANAERRTRFIGPLTVVCDRVTPVAAEGGTGCALEGSIYNDRELADELGEDPRRGHEVLLASAYERWGEQMLDRLRGGFAFAVWSRNAERILLAQDQVAVGALFLYRSGGELAFAAEVHDLLALLPRTPAPDEIAMVRWLSFEYHYDGLTVFEGVRRLGAGRCLSIAFGQMTERQYWRPAYAPPFEGSRLEIAARLRDALVRSVDLRIRDAANVGITLSGGFDSSAVAAATSVAKRNGQVLRGYSTVFPADPAMDDSDMLDALVDALPLENTRYQVDPGGTVAMSLMYLRDWRLPMSGPGWIVERPFMEQAAKDGVEVMLDGQGGDEIFGIPIYLVADRIRAGRLASAAQLIRHGIPVARAALPWRQTFDLMVLFGFRAAAPYRVYSSLRRWLDPGRHAPELLSERGVELFADFNDELRWAKSGSGPLWWRYMRHLLIDDREATGLGDFARQRSMWVGIEGRPPLFDVDLIETALRLPPEFSFDPYLNRPLAREAVAGVLPDAVRLSPRKSNLAPFYFGALSGRDMPLVRVLLGKGPLEISPWVRTEFIRGLLDNPPPAKTRGWYQWLNAIWASMTAESWLRSLSDPSFAERTLERADVTRLEYAQIR